MTGHRLVRRVHQHEAAGAIGVLGHAAIQARLAEGRRLLVAGDPGNGNTRTEQAGGGFTVNFAARPDLGQQASRHAHCAQQIVVPVADVNVVQQGAAGIAGVGDVQRAAGKVPHQPGVDRAEGQLAALGAFARAGDIVEQPADLGAAEIGVEQQAGLLPEQLIEAVGAQPVAQGGRAPVLPDDGVVDRLAGFTIPDQRRFALVGDADSGDIGGAQSGRGDGFLGRAELRRPDIARVVLNPAGLRKYLAEFALRLATNAAVTVEDDGAAGRRALIEGQDEGCHAFDMAQFVPEVTLLPIVLRWGGGAALARSAKSATEGSLAVDKTFVAAGK